MLSMTNHDLYGRGVDSVLVLYGLRSRIEFGDRAERQLVSLADLLLLDNCCTLNCAHQIGEQGISRHWTVFQTATTERDQDLAAL